MGSRFRPKKNLRKRRSCGNLLPDETLFYVEEPMSDKRQKEDSETRKPVQTFRNGAVGGSVWLKQSNTGYWYYDFSLSRSWKSMSSGKDGYSANFFERNREVGGKH